MKGIDEFQVPYSELEKPLSVHRYDLDIVVSDFSAFRLTLGILLLERFDDKVPVIVQVMEHYR